MTPADKALCIRVVTALRFDIPMSVLVGPSAKREHAHARWIAMRLIHDTGVFSLGEVGVMFGCRHHTTVHHGINQVDALQVEDKETRAHFRAIRSAMRKIEG